MAQKTAKIAADAVRQQNWINLFNGSIAPFLLLIAKYTLGYVVIIVFIILLGRMFAKKQSRPPTNDTKQRSAKDAKNGGFFSRIRNPYKNVDDFAVARPLNPAGRTNQVSFMDPTGSYATDESSLAVRLDKPDPIRWNIDPTQTASFQTLPLQVIKDLQNSPKLEVTIPWKSDGYSYRPDCSAATYRDGKSASDLLIDQGNSCRLASGISSEYSSQNRPLASTQGYAGLDKYATEATPRC